jgi:POT family proton-dependent oligopeptide transporter
MQTKHPPALPVFFLTEMWERFGFYVVQGLLILYITHALSFSDDKGYSILAAFTALAYIMPVIGGYFADNVLGFKKTIILGNILLAVGYALLVMHGEYILYPALAMIVTGTGFFKPNISSMLGIYYGDNDSRREAGFTIFYIGINVGALASTATSGFIQEHFGWYASFGVASLGLIVGMLTFLIGMRIVERRTTDTERRLFGQTKFSALLQNKFILLVSVICLILFADLLIQHRELSQVLIWGGSALIFAWLMYSTFRYPMQIRNKMLALICLVISSIVFWALFFQMYFAFDLFIDRCVQRTIGTFTIPTVAFMSVESICLLILGGLFAYFWRVLSERNRNPSLGFKFSLATLTLSAGFLCLIAGIHFAGLSGMVNPLWVVAAYFLLAVAELLLSPVGLSMVTVLAPKEKVAFLMGVWFLALGLGGEFAGTIAKQAAVPKTLTDPHLIAQLYEHAFGQYVIYSLVVGLIILLASPTLRTLANGENLSWKKVFSIR